MILLSVCLLLLHALLSLLGPLTPIDGPTLVLALLQVYYLLVLINKK